MKILLLTKNYPPQIGGIERYSFNLFTSLRDKTNQVIDRESSVYLIAAGPRNEWLLKKLNEDVEHKSPTVLHFIYRLLYIYSEFLRLTWFMVRCLTWGLYLSFRSDLIWCMDWSIAAIGVLLGIAMSKKTRVTLHGRDVSWNKYFYQKMLKYFLQKTDEIIAVSPIIKNITLQLGIDEKKIRIEEHTVDFLWLPRIEVFDRIFFLEKYNIPNDKILLFSIGRFVTKKGFHWFLSEVLPHLDAWKFHYVLTGSWQLELLYRNIISEKHLTNVTLTWTITDPLEKARFYTSMNYFIMPNVSVSWDCEGFGLVLLEAKNYHLPILVSDVDGLGERVQNYWHILPASNSSEWVKYISKIEYAKYS